MIRRVPAVLAAVVICAGAAACGDAGQGREMPAPPPPPEPPTPELPMTGAKAREIIGDLPLPCIEMATLKMDMLTCEERQGRAADHEALRTELRDLRRELQSQAPEAAAARCSDVTNELRTRPKPQVCWDLGLG